MNKKNECKHEYEEVCKAGGKFMTGALSQCKKCMKIKWKQEGIGALM
jgi:hypothetical protein